MDFKIIFDDVEPLAYSHALVLLNKQEIIRKLITYLHYSPTEVKAGLDKEEEANSDDENIEDILYQGEEKEQKQSQDPSSNSVLKGKVLEMFIALVKDLRQEIYSEFKTEILPEAIALIDVQNLNLLD